MPPLRDAWHREWPFLLFAAALPIGVYGRIVAGWQMPLWFDETFSGTIAGQHDVAHLFVWCRHELTGPGFYMPLWAWSRLAGISDVALRLPSLACSIATPLLVARLGHPDRRVRLVWAALVLLWAPSLVTATEARPYAQLFLLGSGQAIAFLHVMRRPRIASAFAWSVCTSLMGLTHYHALAIGLCEGLALLALHPRRTLACWPALTAFVPLLAWMPLHLPFVIAYGRQHDAIYGTLTTAVLPVIPTGLYGTALLGMVVIGGVGAIALLRNWRPGRRCEAAKMTPDLVLALCGVAAIILELALGFVHSGFVARYLTPSMPAVLFGCAIWARRMERSDGALVAGVIAAIAIPFALGLHAARAHPAMDERHLFNFERASAWLAERRPDRLAFFWSDGVGGISADRQVGEVAGFFLRRVGIDVAVAVVHPVTDASTALRAAAGADPHAAILWIANDSASRTRAVPNIAEQDPRWDCRDFGEGVTTLTACRR